MQSELLLNLQLAMGTALLVVLGVFTFFLIERVRKRRAQADCVEESEPAFPFPKRRDSEEKCFHLPQSPKEMDAAIQAAYSQWLESFLLPDAEPGRAFVRAGVAKNWMRYQLTANSMAQALGMLISVLMAGADPLAQTRFDALLAFCLSRLSANHPDLMSWQVMPDVVPGARLDADPRAEAWLAFALLCGAAQWKRSSRFDYAQLAKQRLDALLKQLTEAAPKEDSTLIPAHLARNFAYEGGGRWLKLEESARYAEIALVKHKPDFTQMDSEQKVQAAWYALAWGLCPDDRPAGSAGGFIFDERFLRSALAEIKRSEADEVESDSSDPETLSPFSQLACFGIAAAATESGELRQDYWRELGDRQPEAGDAVAASLRLLALAALSGDVWFGEIGLN